MPGAGLAGGVPGETAYSAPLIDALCTVSVDENVIMSEVPVCTMPERGLPVLALKMPILICGGGGGGVIGGTVNQARQDPTDCHSEHFSRSEFKQMGNDSGNS
jgi:hypothetical protein